ncbi:MAG TPA: type ISP restriction/modification enzyme [Methylomirabilota bacterium]|nr:type ISP restriction/modification enzyme [Methylomirabilota bacterium]
MTLPLQTYLAEMHRLWSTGVATGELSYYTPLQNLFNELGRTLKPKVFCLSNPKDTGAGHPDFYFFTASQLPKAKSLKEPIPEAPPERGVVEAKRATADVRKRIETKQVSDYLRHYGLILVTNYRDFALVGQGPQGEKILLERYQLAASEDAFRQLTAHPAKMAKEQNTRFVEFLTRVLLHRAPLAQPKDVAWFLASYARDALARMEEAGDLPALAAVRTALEQALGLKFEGEKGEHFFRSTLVQTLFYGVFSAWVLWSRQQPPGSLHQFDWHAAAWSLHVPMVRTLFAAVATRERLGPLGLVEVLDWAASALNRVDRTAFFAKFEEAEAVQYFYEPFLEAFDPELRKQLGVWYTPPEIVKYMVARVDSVLRSELKLADGLADPQVYVLDPCCGTGSYLVEVLHCIERTLRTKGESALLAHDIKQAVMTRIFGFEIMPAPYVIAHWQVGIAMHSIGVALDDAHNERAGVYLTNALTGWEPPAGPKPQLSLAYPEFAQEREEASHVKRDSPILVVLGNPPYNAYAGTSPDEEGGLVDVYKEGLIPEWGIKKFNLDDLYVRFFRIAERRIAEQTGRGVISYISNFSYLSDPSFVVMRRRFLREFDRIWIDCMNGDSRETGKLTPDGNPDPSVFSTQYNKEGIRVGTALCLLVRGSGPKHTASVSFRHFWGPRKRTDLLDSLSDRSSGARYSRSHPSRGNRFSFRPERITEHYREWPLLTDMCAIPPMNGLMEKRASALIDIDDARLADRMRRYFDKATGWEALRTVAPGLTRNAGRFAAAAARKKITEAERFDETRIRRYLLRPFDVRWCYYSGVRPLWNEPRPALWAQCWDGNSFLIARPAAVASPEGIPVFHTRLLGDNDFQRGHAYYFPLQLLDGRRLKKRNLKAVSDLFEETSTFEHPIANLSKASRSYLTKVALGDPDTDDRVARMIWFHALAVGYAPQYLSQNADGIRSDWPRIPMPIDRERLEASAALGRQLADLLDPEAQVPGVTSGGVRAELRAIGNAARAGGGALKPREFEVTVGWGHAGKGGVTMPGQGRREERAYAPDEEAAIVTGARALGLSDAEFFDALGRETSDVYLNDTAYWSNVPARVWDYTIGGYQVIKKWLSYREQDLLGRALSMDEIRYVRDTSRRIAAILLLQPALDANYRAVIAETYAWPRN